MRSYSALLALVLLAGCASSSQPVPSVASASAISPGAASSTGPPPDVPPPPERAVSTRPADWALAIVGTPFVFGFRVAVCAATAAVAGPFAAIVAVSDDPGGGFDYLRDGLAQNCGPPYGVPLPTAADRAREPAARYTFTPDGQPRRLTPYTGANVMTP